MTFDIVLFVALPSPVTDFLIVLAANSYIRTFFFLACSFIICIALITSWLGCLREKQFFSMAIIEGFFSSIILSMTIDTISNGRLFFFGRLKDFTP